MGPFWWCVLYSHTYVVWIQSCDQFTIHVNLFLGYIRFKVSWIQIVIFGTTSAVCLSLWRKLNAWTDCIQICYPGIFWLYLETLFSFSIIQNLLIGKRYRMTIFSNSAPTVLIKSCVWRLRQNVFGEFSAKTKTNSRPRKVIYQNRSIFGFDQLLVKYEVIKLNSCGKSEV